MTTKTLGIHIKLVKHYDDHTFQNELSTQK